MDGLEKVGFHDAPRRSSSMRAVLSLGLALAVASVPLAPRLGGTGAAAAPALASITLTPVADAYVSQPQPSTNYNSATNWPVQRDTMLRERYTLLRFDLSAIPEGSEVTSAELGLYLSGASGASIVELAVERITFTWSQSSVTWNSRPPMQGRWATLDVGNSPGWRDFDVRVLTNNWVRGSLPNHGVAVRGPEDVVYLRQFNATGGTKPRLVVVYVPPALTPTASPTATTSATSTATGTASHTPTATATPSHTATTTASASETPTATASATASSTASSTSAPTAHGTLTPTATATPTASSSATTSPSPMASATATSGQTTTATATPSITVTPDLLATATALAATLTAVAPTGVATASTGTVTPESATATPSATAGPTPTMGPIVGVLFVPSAERP